MDEKERIEEALRKSPHFHTEDDEPEELYYDQDRHIRPFEWMASISRLLYVSLKPYYRNDGKGHVFYLDIIAGTATINMIVDNLEEIINALRLAKLNEIADNLC